MNKLFFLSNCLFAALLASPMIPGAGRYFANAYLCTGIILLLVFLNYRLYKALVALTAAGRGLAVKDSEWKLNARVLAWAVLIPAVMFAGVGPITSPSAYYVDSFSRVFGLAVTDDYSVSKKVHYFYYVLIIYCLLVFSFYQNIRLALLNNLKSKIRRLGAFSDTLLFVGWSFLLVCVYRQFSSEYSYDLTLYLLKSFMVFMIPAFCLWETGKLRVQDVRIMLALALFSLVLSVNIVLYFDTRKLGGFSVILAAVLFESALIFIARRTLWAVSDRVLYSKIMSLSLIGSLSIIFFSLAFEFFNVLAFKTGQFTDVAKFFHTVFYSVCWLSLGWCLCCRKLESKKTAGIALFVFVLGVSLIQFQPSLVIRSPFHAFETANSAVPVIEFLNYGKIPFFENFPGHGLNGVISSIAYGLLTSDYFGTIFSPWRNWLYCSVCIIALFCFTKSISNGLVAVTVSILLPYFVLPYLHEYTSYSCIGLFAVIPFVLYLKTLKKKYLVLTVILALFFVAYKLDIGFSILAGIFCSAICVSIFYRNRTIYRVLVYFAVGIAVVFALFLTVCLLKNISPVSRIQEFLSITSSNDYWGWNNLGDTEKNTYYFVYFILPFLSVVCFAVTIAARSRLSIAQFALSLCLIFAYFFNIPRFLVMHSLVQYCDFFSAMWLSTMPLEVSLLIALLFNKKSMFVLCQTLFVLFFYILFMQNIYHSNSPLKNLVMRAESISAEVSAETRKKDINFVYSRAGRVVIDGGDYCGSSADNMLHVQEMKAAADLLLSPDETFLDFTSMSAAYAVSQRENPVYVVQSPEVLAGEQSQRAFIREVEARLNNVPIVFMPANFSWCQMMFPNGLSTYIKHYLVAEWIYSNYRPLVKYNDFVSVWALNSRYDEFYKRLNAQYFLNGNNTLTVSPEFSYSLTEDKIQLRLSLIDWGYDNFISMPEGVLPAEQYISNAHDYDVRLLPYIWGQFDSRIAADNADLVNVSFNGGIYSWNCAGKQSKPAYLRMDLTVSQEFMKNTSASSLVLGNIEAGRFTPLNKFRFRLKEGKNVYLFRISSDYYWSRGQLTALSLDPKLANSVTSVRILEGD